MKIDSHQHFWHYSPESHSWIPEHMSDIRRNFLPPDLLPELSMIGFDGCVAVQADQTLNETTFLLDLADQNSFIKAVTGWVPILSPSLSESVEQFFHRKKLRAFRHIVQAEPDDYFIARPNFIKGVKLLSDMGYAYEILVYPHQIEAAIEFAKALPYARLVLDHMAKPKIGQGLMEPWLTNFRKIATIPNVWCKLSGLVTEAYPLKPTYTLLEPYLDIALEAFSANRLMIGSDWPVCLPQNQYGQTMGFVNDYVNKLSDNERAKILGLNAANFYGIADSE